MMAAPFCHGDALLAKRAFFRFIGGNSQVKESLYLIFRHAEFGFTAAAVYEEADSDNDTASFFDYIYHFLDASSSRYNIFYNQDPFARFNMESAAQRHNALFPF